MKKGNYITSILGMVFSISIILITLSFPESKNGVPGPGVFPLIVSILLFLSSLVLFIKTIFDKDNITPLEFSKDSKRSFIIMGILIFYLIVLPFLGMLIANTLLLGSLFIWFNKKQYLLYIGLSIVISVGIFLLFDKVLAVPLDFGLLFF